MGRLVANLVSSVASSESVLGTSPSYRKPTGFVRSCRLEPMQLAECSFCRANAKTPAFRAGVLGLGSLTITYFHTGIRTIIGVESFHGPVRDGKG
ncbi:hypothetical protein ACIQHE_17565, partial [Burkholderia vietnamiensis]|uniref:hypothetical protein n=2 Tax=Burkholderia vietnamiensis TaxID=60552 RepID=UPI00382B9F9A